MDQETVFQSLSWIGVVLVVLTHAAVSMNVRKREASYISALGALTALVSAAGIGIWPVFWLNAFVFLISAFGSRIPERETPIRIADIGSVSIGLLVVALWVVGPAAVSWASTAAFVAGWLLFSSGLATRRGYLATSVLAGASVVPALYLLGAPAFAANGAFMAAFGAWGLVFGTRSAGR